MIDLNAHECNRTSLYLIFGNDINDQGVIVGYAVDQRTGNARACLAIPNNDGCEIGHAARPRIRPPQSILRRFGLLDATTRPGSPRSQL
jgi:hypothetical protein